MAIWVALTSPYRLLIAAAALTVLRHAIAPRPAIVSDIPLATARRVADAGLGDRATGLRRHAPGHPVRRLLRRHHAWLQQQRRSSASIRRQRIPEPAGQVGHRLVHQRRDRRVSISHARCQRTAEHRIFSRVPGRDSDCRRRFFGGLSLAFLWGGTMARARTAFSGRSSHIYRFAREFIRRRRSARWAVWVMATYPFAF